MFLVDCMQGAANWINECTNFACIPDGIAKITTILYNAVRIITPLILIIVGMFDMAKAVAAGKEDEIKRAQQMLVKKAAAAAIVFLLFSIVTFVLGIVNGNNQESKSFVACVEKLLKYNG